MTISYVSREDEVIASCLETSRKAGLLHAAIHLEQAVREHEAAAKRFSAEGEHYKAREAAHAARVIQTLAKQVSQL